MPLSQAVGDHRRDLRRVLGARRLGLDQRRGHDRLVRGEPGRAGVGQVHRVGVLVERGHDGAAGSPRRSAALDEVGVGPREALERRAGRRLVLRAHRARLRERQERVAVVAGQLRRRGRRSGSSVSPGGSASTVWRGVRGRGRRPARERVGRVADADVLVAAAYVPAWNGRRPTPSPRSGTRATSRSRPWPAARHRPPWSPTRPGSRRCTAVAGAARRAAAARRTSHRRAGTAGPGPRGRRRPPTCAGDADDGDDRTPGAPNVTRFVGRGRFAWGSVGLGGCRRGGVESGGGPESGSSGPPPSSAPVTRGAERRATTAG